MAKHTRNFVQRLLGIGTPTDTPMVLNAKQLIDQAASTGQQAYFGFKDEVENHIISHLKESILACGATEEEIASILPAVNTLAARVRRLPSITKQANEIAVHAQATHLQSVFSSIPDPRQRVTPVVHASTEEISDLPDWLSDPTPLTGVVACQMTTPCPIFLPRTGYLIFTLRPSKRKTMLLTLY